MRTMIATLLATLLATQAHAESWGGKDKWQHAIVGAGTGAVFAKATNDWRYGCAAAAAVGLAKELYDRKHRDRHTPSFNKFAFTTGAGCGSPTFGWTECIGVN